MTTKILTQKQYAEKYGIHCPVCGGDDIVGDSLEFQAPYVFQNIRCLSCEAHWADVYVLDGYTELRDKDDNILEIPDDSNAEERRFIRRERINAAIHYYFDNALPKTLHGIKTRVRDAERQDHETNL